MRRYMSLLPLVCAVISLLGGCGTEAPSTVSYDVYFPSKTGEVRTPALCAETRTLPQNADPVEGLLRSLLEGPTHETLTAAVPSGVRLHAWKLEEGVLTVDFSGWYGSLSGIDLTLADYSITLTMGQLPTVDRVVITVEGENISYRNHADLSPKDVTLTVYRNESVKRTVTLYFPNADGSGLSQEVRNVELTEDATLTFTVLQALTAGPEDASKIGILSSNEIRSVKVRDGICYLDLAASFAELATEQEQADRLTIYAIVNTLCSLDGVEAVRFLSEGEPMVRYGAVSLGEPVQRDASLP